MPMPSALKRELLFWWVVAVATAGYIALGMRLAPEVPPEPENRFEVIRLRDSRDVVREFEKFGQRRREYNNAVLRHNEFLRDWYRWGAGLVIGLVLLHTFLRPPWRARTDETPRPRDKPAKPGERVLSISRSAMLRMAATLLLVIVVFVLIAALFP